MVSVAQARATQPHLAFMKGAFVMKRLLLQASLRRRRRKGLLLAVLFHRRGVAIDGRQHPNDSAVRVAALLDTSMKP